MASPTPPKAALICYYASFDDPQLLCSNNRCVVFDTAENARDFAPLLRDGMRCLWSEDGETLWFMNPDLSVPREGLLKVEVVTNYDPYDLPPNFHPWIKSETPLKAWRHHIHWGEFLHNMEKASEEMKRQRMLNQLNRGEMVDGLFGDAEIVQASDGSMWTGERTSNGRYRRWREATASEIEAVDDGWEDA